ncbi:MAG TPA: prolipoprotein diacylglyceryl transferase [Candidatus Methylacidiphilales bacterium]
MSPGFLAHYVDNLSPFLVEFGKGSGIGIRYYGLAYLLGFVFLFWFLHRQIALGWLRISHEEADRALLKIALLGVLVGGRLGYALFYDLDETVHRPWTLLMVWKGGMASHGGILGVIAVMIWEARRLKIPFYHLADAAALCTPVGLGLGRIANFVNGELWGRPFDGPWAVVFPKSGDLAPRHPSQLYEAVLEGAVLFGLLLLVRLRSLKREPRRDGATALAFMGAYGVLRIVGECFREPDVQIGYYFGAVTQGQILSAAMVAAAIVLEAVRRLRFAERR